MTPTCVRIASSIPRNDRMTQDHNGLRRPPSRSATAGGLGDECRPSKPGPRSPTTSRPSWPRSRPRSRSSRTRGCAPRPRRTTSASRPRPTSPRRTSTRSSASPRTCCRSRTRSRQTLAAGNASLETLRAGVELTLKALQAAFDRAQVVEINPVRREVRSAPPPGDADGRLRRSRANTVVDVFQKGYLLNDRVLRPALVTVAKARTESA